MKKTQQNYKNKRNIKCICQKDIKQEEKEI